MAVGVLGQSVQVLWRLCPGGFVCIANKRPRQESRPTTNIKHSLLIISVSTGSCWREFICVQVRWFRQCGPKGAQGSFVITYVASTGPRANAVFPPSFLLRMHFLSLPLFSYSHSFPSPAVDWWPKQFSPPVQTSNQSTIRQCRATSYHLHMRR